MPDFSYFEEQTQDYLRVGTLKSITYLLLRLGFQARQKGYRYLREAVCIACQKPESINSVTKLVYPEVANRFNTTSMQVERAIRTTIETAWKDGDKEVLQNVFGDLYKQGNTRPTNTAVIERLAAAVNGGSLE